MNIPVKYAQFGQVMRMGGRTFNSVLDTANPRDAAYELFAITQGLIVRTSTMEALVPWGSVVHAEPAEGFSFVNGRTLPTLHLPTPGTDEKPVTVDEGRPPVIGEAKRGPGRPRKF